MRRYTSTNQNGGIIASRLYNRPSNDYLNQTYTLRLRKFDNARVRKMLRRYLPTSANNIILKLFKERIDLVELCRNPFHLSLLIDYINNATDFPKNQFELFKHFIEGRLEKSRSQVEELGFTSKEIYEAAIDLSVMMQRDSSYGLDFPVSRVILSGKRMNKERWEKCITILTYAKICRMGGNHQTVSFVHRRFQEFFFVEALIRNREQVTDKELIGILDNTGMRDALVLYCQIAEEDRVREIISFCCENIETNKDKIGGVLSESSIKLINSLYFLIESFSNRKQMLNDDIDTIKQLRKYIKRETHYAILVAIVNSISLLEPEDVQRLMLEIFSINNRWLKVLMVSKCQFIQKLDRKTEIGFCQLFENSNTANFIHNFNNVNFSLSLSGCFAYVKRIHTLFIGVAFSTIIHTWTAIILLIPLSISLFATGATAYYIDSIAYLFGGTLNLLNSNNPRYNQTSVFTSFINQPVTGLRSFLHLNIIVFILLVAIVKISEMRSTVSKHSDHDGVVASTDDKFSITLLGSLIKENFYRVKDSIKRDQNVTGITFSAKNDFHKSLLLMFLVVSEYCPNGPFLILVTALEFYVTLYYLYRCIHEIIIPMIKAGNIFNVITKVIGIIKSIPRLIAEQITSIVASLVVVVLFYSVIIIAICVVIFVVPSTICYLTGNELSSTNAAIIIMIIMLTCSLFLLVYCICMVVKDNVIIYRMSRNSIKAIDRNQLILNMKKYYYEASRRKYVKRLMDNSVKLTGDWPDDYTSKIKDDLLIRRLAIWDSKDLKIKSLYIESL